MSCDRNTVFRFCSCTDFFFAEFSQLLFEPMKIGSIKISCAKELPREGSIAHPTLLVLIQLPAVYFWCFLVLALEQHVYFFFLTLNTFSISFCSVNILESVYQKRKKWSQWTKDISSILLNFLISDQQFRANLGHLKGKEKWICWRKFHTINNIFSILYIVRWVHRDFVTADKVG